MRKRKLRSDILQVTRIETCRDMSNFIFTDILMTNFLFFTHHVYSKVECVYLMIVASILPKEKITKDAPHLFVGEFMRVTVYKCW